MANILYEKALSNKEDTHCLLSVTYVCVIPWDPLWEPGRTMWMCQHWWFSGRILACHAGGPGSIPGQCKPNFLSVANFFIDFLSFPEPVPFLSFILFLFWFSFGRNWRKMRVKVSARKCVWPPWRIQSQCVCFESFSLFSIFVHLNWHQ